MRLHARGLVSPATYWSKKQLSKARVFSSLSIYVVPTQSGSFRLFTNLVIGELCALGVECR